MRDILKALQQGRVEANVVAVVMLGGPLDGKHYYIDAAADEMELLDPEDAHESARLGYTPRLAGLYKRFGTMMIWQKEYDNALDQMQPVSQSEYTERRRHYLQQAGRVERTPVHGDDEKD